MAATHDAPTLHARTGLAGGDGPGCRSIIAAQSDGWSEPAIMEWELKGESWTDWHPHIEYNFVIDGQLFVESGGVTVEAQIEYRKLAVERVNRPTRPA